MKLKPKIISNENAFVNDFFSPVKIEKKIVHESELIIIVVK